MIDRELMQQAVEKLEFFGHMKSISKDTQELITTLRGRLAQPQMQPCAGRNCGSTNPNLHSAECFEDYEKATGMNQKFDAPDWNSYKQGWEDGVIAEREACAELAMQGTNEPVQTKTLEILRKERERIAESIRARGQA